MKRGLRSPFLRLALLKGAHEIIIHGLNLSWVFSCI
jgi:hypothetical protein